MKNYEKRIKDPVGRQGRQGRSQDWCLGGGGQAPRGPAPRGPRVPPKPENYADLAHYFSERAQIVE